MEQLLLLAIRERRLIEFTLHGLRRVGEPHILGIRRGVHQLLVYQTHGQSKSGRLPNWRTADLTRMTHLRVLEQRFSSPRLTADQESGWEQVFASVT